MTQDEYIIAVQAEVDDTSLRARTIIVNALQSTYNEIVKRLGKWLLEEEEISFNAITDQRYIDITDDFYRIDRVFYKEVGGTVYKELRKMSPFDYDVNEIASAPEKYYVKGKRLYFNCPVVDAGIIKMQYIPIVDMPLTGAIIIPNVYKDVLIAGSVARFFEYEGDQGYQVYATQFKRSLDEMEKDYSTRDRIDRPKLY